MESESRVKSGLRSLFTEQATDGIEARIPQHSLSPLNGKSLFPTIALGGVDYSRENSLRTANQNGNNLSTLLIHTMFTWHMKLNILKERLAKQNERHLTLQCLFM